MCTSGLQVGQISSIGLEQQSAHVHAHACRQHHIARLTQGSRRHRASWQNQPVHAGRRPLHARSQAYPSSELVSSQRLPPALKAGSQHQDKVVIIGAGIAGLATAAGLTKVGIPCVVLERESALRDSGAAIGMWTNAFKALDALGVGGELRESSSLLTSLHDTAGYQLGLQHPDTCRIELCAAQGQVLRSFGLDECDGGPHEFRGVHRGRLLRALADLLPDGVLHFDVRIAEVTPDRNGAMIALEDGSKLRARAVVGADGSRSQVASALGLKAPGYAGYSAYRGVATFESGLPLPGDTCRQIWGAGTRAGMYPLNDREVYWFTVFNAPKAARQLSPEEMRREALQSIQGWAFGVDDAIRQTPAEMITRSRITDRWPLPGTAWGTGAVTVAGDAAHPQTPNLGQGGCCALEDAVVLARTLRDAVQAVQPSNVVWPTPTLRSLGLPQLQDALRRYEKSRSARMAPVVIRSNLFGQALQLSIPPVPSVRNIFIEKFFSPAHFLSHATYDCGSL